MNKYSSLIGFILIAGILFGYSAYQNTVHKQHAEQVAKADSLRLENLRVEHEAAVKAEEARLSQQAAVAAQTAPVAPVAQGVNYFDALLNAHSAEVAESSVITISNDLLELEFTSRGAQIFSARLKEFTCYDSTDLYLVKPNQSYYNIDFYAKTNLKTNDFVFDVVALSDTSVTFRLPFECGGYVEQVYTLNEGSYNLKNNLSFVGLDAIIPRTVSTMDIDWNLVVGRYEKGYKNEKQYSKLDYYSRGDKSPDNIGNGGRDAKKSIPASISWFAFQQQFFSAIMYAEDDFQSADFSLKFMSENNRHRNLMNCMAQARHDFDPKRTEPYNFEFYLGPNHYNTLKGYDRKYEKIITLGGPLVRWVSRWVIIPSFAFLSRFISNWGIVILLMTIFIKLVVSPLTFKTYASSATMAVLRPEIEKLNEKYPKQEDAMKKQQATMELYKKAGVNPMGGCLPMLIQFPILFAMFRFFPASIELRGQRFLWAEDLSAYDSIWDFGFNIPLYGDHMSLFAILMAISMFLISKFQQNTASNDPNMKSMQIMMLYFMPIMMLFICNNLSSGLSYYYLLSNIFSLIQTLVIKKWFIDEKKIRAKMAAASSKPQKKSKWQERLEQAQRMQQEQLRKQQEQARRK